MPQSPRGTDAIRRTRSPRRRAMGTMGSLLAATVSLGTLTTLTATAGSASAAAQHPQATHRASQHTVTLITGDRVLVVTDTAGHTAYALEPSPDGTLPRAYIEQRQGDTYVIPQVASALLSEHKLDSALFDVTGLLRQHYDDAHRATVPVIIDYGQGNAAASQARAASPAARRTVTVASLGIAAFAAPKPDAGTFWDSLTAAPNSSGAPTKLTDGANLVALDGLVHGLVQPTVTDSVAQVHAPQAWDAGYDGSGTKVAVLDSGYDPNHPDLAGQVLESANFTNDPTVVDGIGHGTHVASIIAGTGAAPGGVAEGVAPGAKLLIGKVIDNSGSGEDSMILAGMQWAVNQHADVVNMSLGGDVSDGTDLLSAAVNQYSATTSTLFVIAAGNNGDFGSQTVTAPGAAASALTVGAVDGSDQLASFSGRGPRAGDGIVKPEVVAPGVGIYAARAAGTSMGAVDPNNPYYTSADGTSMATPNVAGIAAILHEEHPSWDGDQLKEAIVGSTVPVLTPAGYNPVTAYDAGTGRVDALRATQTDITADPSLNLGFFKWPHPTPASTSTPLTYYNDGAASVTLTLSMSNEDGTALNAPGVTLSASQVSVPAHGQASVNVDLDPTVASDLASYSGIVVATPDNGANDVRTAFGYTIESEHYDLTVNLVPRSDAVETAHHVELGGNDTNGSTWENRYIDSSPGTKSVTFRVAPGQYALDDAMTGTQADGSSSLSLAWAPLVDVSADTTVTLDAGNAQEVTYRTDRPVIDNGIIVQMGRGNPSLDTGPLVTGVYDHVYMPAATADPGELMSSFVKWDLAQPTAVLSDSNGDSANLRGVPVNGSALRDAAVPSLPGDHPVVDAGSVGALDTTSVSGAIATVAGDCSDLGPTATALASAGAVAMAVYPGDAARCAGMLASPQPLPAFSVSAPQKSQLAAIATLGTGHVASRDGSHYIYDLQGSWDGSVPAAPVLDGTAGHIATYVEHVNTPGAPGPDIAMYELDLGYTDGATYFGAVTPIPAPLTLRHYVSTGFDWEREVLATVKENGATLATVSAPTATPQAGDVIHDRWFGGPLTSRLSPIPGPNGWRDLPSRFLDRYSTSGQSINLNLPAFTDAAGHGPGGEENWNGEFSGKVFRDGKLLPYPYGKTNSPGWYGEVPIGKRGYHFRVWTRLRHENTFWQRSTDVTTVWSFDSAPLGNAKHTLLPMMSVDYRMPMSSTETTPAGKYRFSVSYRLPYKHWSALAHQQVLVSWNGGTLWSKAHVVRCWNNQPGTGNTLGGCTVEVRNHAHRNLSLTVQGRDSAGNLVKQTVIDAYRVD
jgi:subtilisin family serine protease